MQNTDKKKGLHQSHSFKHFDSPESSDPLSHCHNFKHRSNSLDSSHPLTHVRSIVSANLRWVLIYEWVVRRGLWAPQCVGHSSYEENPSFTYGSWGRLTIFQVSCGTHLLGGWSYDFLGKKRKKNAPSGTGPNAFSKGKEYKTIVNFFLVKKWVWRIPLILYLLKRAKDKNTLVIFKNYHLC